MIITSQTILCRNSKAIQQGKSIDGPAGMDHSGDLGGSGGSGGGSGGSGGSGGGSGGSGGSGGNKWSDIEGFCLWITQN